MSPSARKTQLNHKDTSKKHLEKKASSKAALVFISVERLILLCCLETIQTHDPEFLMVSNGIQYFTNASWNFQD